MNDYTSPASKTPMSHEERVEQLRKLVNKAKVGMLTTIDDTQELRSRPMHTVEIDAHGALVFVVSVAAPKTQEMEHHEGKVCVAYANPADQEYVSISGHARLVKDRAAKEAIWNKMFEVWFPKGVEDPNVALLRVVPDKAQYWDGAGNVFTQAWAVAKALATGDKSGFGDSRKIDL